MRLMGLDVGSRTVGVAISDELGWTAQGVEIIQIDEANENFGMKRLKKLVADYQVTGFVLGLPKNMNNTSGPRVAKTKAYGDRLLHKFGLPVDYQDERLSTVQAERMLIEEGNVSRKKRKEVIDKLASVVILQNYLDAHGQLTQQ
ncbi:Holliday junction resolvase RuvX [Lapidilactobacillus salsurivasis]